MTLVLLSCLILSCTCDPLCQITALVFISISVVEVVADADLGNLLVFLFANQFVFKSHDLTEAGAGRR